MGAVVNLHQPCGIDGGVGLGGGQRRVAQQFLDSAQIAACSQQVRGKAVAQGMRRGGGWQAHLRTGIFNHKGDEARIQRAAARTP